MSAINKKKEYLSSDYDSTDDESTDNESINKEWNTDTNLNNKEQSNTDEKLVMNENATIVVSISQAIDKAIDNIKQPQANTQNPDNKN